MRFENPTYLFLLILIPLLIGFYVFAGRERRADLARFGNPELVSRGAGVSLGLRRFKSTLVVLGVMFLILTMAGPQWGATLQKIERKGVDIVVVLDTSLSMLAQDIKPSRLQKARHEIVKLIDMLKGDRIGLVVFAGTSFTICPLTLDYGAAKMFMDTVTTDIVPEKGTATADAIRTAVSNFDPKEEKYKAVILLTDGEDNGEGKDHDPVAAAEEAAKQKVVIYTVGIGSSRGDPIPVPNPGGGVEYKRDRSGDVVMTKLGEEALQKIALATEGKYYRASDEEFELSRIYEKISGMEKKSFEENYNVSYEDRFQWTLAAAVLCLFIEAILPERRRKKKT